jgi:hypothetical protein
MVMVMVMVIMMMMVMVMVMVLESNDYRVRKLCLHGLKNNSNFISESHLLC